MLKFLVYSLLLWQEICIISADQTEFSATDTKIPGMAAISAGKKKESNEGSTRELNSTELNGRYNFHAANQIFNIKDPSFSSNPICSSICPNNCDRRKLGSDYVEANETSAAFKLHRRRLPWNRARRICAEEGGHLAVPRANSEENEIVKMMLENSVDEAWLGIHDQFEEGDWITVLDEPLAKTGWARWSKLFPNNPDNYKGKQNCARLVRNGGGMDDDTCEISKSFVCKISTL